MQEGLSLLVPTGSWRGSAGVPVTVGGWEAMLVLRKAMRGHGTGDARETVEASWF